MRLIVLISGWVSVVGAVACLGRLCFKEWPVTLKYERWEYALKVASGTAWAIWCFLAVYVWQR